MIDPTSLTGKLMTGVAVATLFVLSVSQAVKTKFAQHQRQRASHIVQSLDIAAERLLILQVDIDRIKIQKIQLQVLG